MTEITPFCIGTYYFAAKSQGYFDKQLAKSAFDAGEMRAQLAKSELSAGDMRAQLDKSELDAVALKVRYVVKLCHLICLGHGCCLTLHTVLEKLQKRKHNMFRERQTVRYAPLMYTVLYVRSKR